jgi:hypothetical protein
LCKLRRCRKPLIDSRDLAAQPAGEGFFSSLTLASDQNHIQNGFMPPQPTRKAMRARLGRVFLSGADGLVIAKAPGLALLLTS